MKLPARLLLCACFMCLLPAALGDEPKLSLENALPIAKKVAQAEFKDLNRFYLASGILKADAQKPEQVAWEFRWAAKRSPANEELVVRVDATTGKTTTATEATLQKKLHDVIIAKIELDKASLPEAVAELYRLLHASWPEGANVQFALKLDPADAENQARISMNMKNVPFDELLEFFATMANLSYEIGPSKITMRPKADQNPTEPPPDAYPVKR